MNACALPPGPARPLPWWKTRPRNSRLPRALQALAQQYGDIVRFRLEGKNGYFLNHPRFIAAVFQAEGDAFAPEPGLSSSELPPTLPSLAPAEPVPAPWQKFYTRRLRFALKALRQHPALLWRLHAEAEMLQRNPDTDPRALTTARGAFLETLRLDPPVRVLAYTARREHTIGGYQLKWQDVALISPWVLHRDPRFYPHPERFDPTRWIPDTPLPPLAFIPFGPPPADPEVTETLIQLGTLATAKSMNR